MELITPEELAKQLDGRDYDDKMTKYVIKLARDSGLVIVSAIGDDVIQFSGFIKDEVDCFRGGNIYMDKDGTYTKQSSDNSRKIIQVLWEQHRLYIWKFITKIPHNTYSIKRDGKNFCLGMVFSMKDI